MIPPEMHPDKFKVSQDEVRPALTRHGLFNQSVHKLLEGIEQAEVKPLRVALSIAAMAP